MKKQYNMKAMTTLMLDENDIYVSVYFAKNEYDTAKKRMFYTPLNGGADNLKCKYYRPEEIVFEIMNNKYIKNKKQACRDFMDFVCMAQSLAGLRNIHKSSLDINFILCSRDFYCIEVFGLPKQTESNEECTSLSTGSPHTYDRINEVLNPISLHPALKEKEKYGAISIIETCYRFANMHFIKTTGKKPFD